MIRRLAFMVLLLSLSLYSIVVAAWETPETGTAGYVGSIVSQGTYVFGSSSTAGVYISANNGDQWLARNEGIGTTDVQSMAVIGNTIFAATNGMGVYSSSNSGETWTQKNSGLGNYSVFSLYADEGNLYAVTDESGIFMSSDLGNNWISLNNGDIIGIICYTVTAKAGKIYVGAEYGNLYTTTNNGSTWENLKSGPLAFNIKSIDIKDDKIAVGTSSGFFISNNGGKDWGVMNAGLKNTDITQVRFVTNNSLDYIYAATKGGGLYISENFGTTWVAMNEELPDMNLLSFGFHNNYVYAGSQFSSVARRKMSEMVVPEVKAPNLENPANLSENISPSVTFTWKESLGAKSYKLQIALSDDFSNPIVDRDDLSSTTANQDLEMGLKYFWRVAANTDQNEKKWSDVWSFTTRFDQEPPKLVSPTNMESNVPLVATFVWNESPGTQSYNLFIAKDSLITDRVLSRSNITDTSSTFDGLEENTTYYWIVYSVGFDDNREPSEVWAFSTGEYMSVNNTNNVTSLEECLVYPNPASKMLTLGFGSFEGYVKVSLISILNGSLGFQRLGYVTKSDQWTLDEWLPLLPVGVYALHVESNENRVIIPFVKF